MTKKQALIVAEYVAKLSELVEYGDSETAHAQADNLLLDALTELGFVELADAWKEVEHDVGFWYA